MSSQWSLLRRQVIQYFKCRLQRDYSEIDPTLQLRKRQLVKLARAYHLFCSSYDKEDAETAFLLILENYSECPTGDIGSADCDKELREFFLELYPEE